MKRNNLPILKQRDNKMIKLPLKDKVLINTEANIVVHSESLKIRWSLTLIIFAILLYFVSTLKQ